MVCKGVIVAIEIYVLYSTQPFSGYIVNTGRINRINDAANPDGSTTLERISDKLSNNAEYAVAYLPDQKLPNRETTKYVGGELVPLEEGDKTHDVTEKEKLDEADSMIDLAGIADMTYGEVATWADGVVDVATARSRINKIAVVVLAILKTLGK